MNKALYGHLNVMSTVIAELPFHLCSSMNAIVRFYGIIWVTWVRRKRAVIVQKRSLFMGKAAKKCKHTTKLAGFLLCE